MPEFIVDTAGGVALPDVPAGNSQHYWASLDAFTQGYMEALFFTDSEPGAREDWNPETDSSLPGDVGFSDLAPDTLASIIAVCEEFQLSAGHLLAEAYGH